jgi:hypothetical protein
MNKRNSTFLLLGLGLMLLIFSGCKTTRPGLDMPLKQRSPEFLYKKLVSQQMQPEWLSAKARIGYQDRSQRVSATATIHLRRDSLIWIALRKLGFEVARVQITPDSIYLLDRINNEYAIEDFQFLSREFRFPANFQVLQAILLGHPLFFGLEGYEAGIERQHYVLRRDDGELESDYRLNGNDFRMAHMAFRDKVERRQLGIAFEEYGELDGQQKFSYLRNIQLYSRDWGDVEMDISFSKVELNRPQSLRFSIPERYSRAR